MGDNKRRRKLELGAVMIVLIAVGIGFYYTTNDSTRPYYTRELEKWVFVFLGFMLATMAQITMNVFGEQALSVAPKISHFDGEPHVMLCNDNYGELIDIRVLFELIEVQTVGKGPFVGCLKRVETVALSSIPARISKQTASVMYVQVPEKMAKQFTGEDQVHLMVRAISVHPATNFRGITEARVFTPEQASELDVKPVSLQSETLLEI